MTISCSVYRWDPHTTLELCVNGIVPIGAVHTGTRYLIHDPELGVGAETGELCVTGEQMFPGYLDPQDNEGRFLEHDGERWYRTGDLVRELEGGDLVYLGRRDHQVKISGVRVELAEVEWALRRVSGITDAVAAVHEGALVAFCVGDRRPLAQIAEELGAFLPPRPGPPQVHLRGRIPAQLEPQGRPQGAGRAHRGARPRGRRRGTRLNPPRRLRPRTRRGTRAQSLNWPRSPQRHPESRPQRAVIQYLSTE